jgi:hypothetical protein
LLGSAILLVMWRPRASSIVFVGLAVTVVAIFLFVPAGSLNRLATIPEEVGGGDLNDRLNIWDAGWHAFTRSPWWGYGAGTFTTAAGLASGDTAHNTVMAVLVTGGASRNGDLCGNSGWRCPSRISNGRAVASGFGNGDGGVADHLHGGVGGGESRHLVAVCHGGAGWKAGGRTTRGDDGSVFRSEQQGTEDASVCRQID